MWRNIGPLEFYNPINRKNIGPNICQGIQAGSKSRLLVKDSGDDTVEKVSEQIEADKKGKPIFFSGYHQPQHKGETQQAITT